MSVTNDIKNLLDIQDENITFEEDCVQDEEYKGRICTFITGKLTYDPKYCERCNAKNIDYIVYKNGTQTSRITIPITGVKPTYLRLKKQRFFCKACDRSFTAKSPIVEKHCFISKQVM